VGFALWTVQVIQPGVPVIFLVGDPFITTEAGKPFEDPLARITDEVDGDLSRFLRSDASRTVNTNRLGEYTVTYSMDAVDSQNLRASSVTRVVLVQDTINPVGGQAVARQAEPGRAALRLLMWCPPFSHSAGYYP
jgi:hypothetical protein